MAIDRIPGVGPTNADIATAVAAPSAATIAAAVAAPSAATIAAAVAAPSSATIASAVAAAVPTRANIQSDIGTYAPSPLAWTLVGSTALSGAATTTFSSLSGYKKYRLIVSACTNSSMTQQMGLRINADATAGAYPHINGTGAQLSNTYLLLWLSGTLAFNAYGNNGSIDIENANVASPKRIGYGFWCVNSGSTSASAVIEGMYKGTASITSITYFNATGADTWTGGTAYLLGAN